MTNLSDLIGELEAITESQRLLCLALDGFAQPNSDPSSIAVTNFARTVEDMLDRVIDDLKDKESTQILTTKGA